MNEEQKKENSFDTPEINNVTQTSGVIPADVVATPQPTLNVPEINMRETAPLANQSVNEAQAQVQDQTKLQELTAQKIADRDKQRLEQQNLIATLGGQGQEIQQAFQQGEEALKPIEKEITDLTALINTKTSAIQNQLIDEAGRRIPQAFITGRQALIQQRGTAELSALSGLLDAKNGQMTLAQNKFDRSLNILREVNRAELAEKEARVSLLKEITGESKEEETKEIERLKAEQEKYDKERDAISAIGLQAMQAGAGADEINAIVNAKTKDEAIAAAKSLGRAAKMQYALQSAQLDKIKAEKKALDNASITSVTPDGKRVLDQKTADDINTKISNRDEYKALTGDSQKAIDALNEYEKILNELGGADFSLLPSSDKNRLNTAFTNVKLFAKDFFELGVIAGPDEGLLEDALGGKPTGVAIEKVVGITPIGLVAGQGNVRENRRTKSINSAISQFKTGVVNGIDANVMSIEGIYGDISDQNIKSLQTVRSRRDEALASIITDPDALEKTFDEELPDEEFFNTN